MPRSLLGEQRSLYIEPVTLGLRIIFLETGRRLRLLGQTDKESGVVWYKEAEGGGDGLEREEKGTG